MILDSELTYDRHISMSTNLLFLKKLWCCVRGRVKHENSVLLNELRKVNYHRERFKELTFRPLTLRIRSDKGLTLETSAFQIFYGGNSTFINSFDKTKFSSFYDSRTLYVCISCVRVTVPRTASTKISI